MRTPFPFEPVFDPFISSARRELSEVSGHAYAFVSAEGHRQFERNLLQLLTDLAAEALELKFSLFRHRYPPVLNNSREYAVFLNEMKRGGFAELLSEYVALGRLLRMACSQWVDSTAEFLHRLQKDWNEKVVHVAPGLSDRHHGGRTVIAVVFQSGSKVVYKPRTLTLDAAYFRLLDWFNQNGAPEAFRTVKIVDHTDYGWMEFVEHEPCKDLPAARRYYRRMGMLQCVLYVLDSTDCHMGNLIAGGEYPVFVDLETLFQPHPSHSSEAMLRSRLLPNTEDPYDLSAFSGADGMATEYRIPKWNNVNTNRLSLTFARARIRKQANLPYLRGRGLRPLDYVEEIVDGFREMYLFLMSKRTALVGQRGRLNDLHNLSNRILFRPTRDYIAMLNQSLHLRNLRNPSENRIKIDHAGKRFRAVIEAERAALQRLDVPYFSGRTDIKRSIVRINAMSVRSLSRQAKLIKTALLLKVLQQQTA